MSREKLFRALQRKLTADEIHSRRSFTREVIDKLRQDPVWSDWITGAILFGSTARDDARTGSDVDVAILTEQDFFFGLDFPYITNQFRKRIIEI